MDPDGVGRRPTVSDPLDDLYQARFDEREQSAKQGVWDEIVRYLQRYVDPKKPVLDLACDRGHFIRPIRASEKWATDIRDMSAVLPALSLTLQNCVAASAASVDVRVLDAAFNSSGR